jgi:hypothetical protein
MGKGDPGSQYQGRVTRFNMHLPAPVAPLRRSSCCPRCSITVGAGRRPLVSVVDPPQLRREARAVLGLEPAHVLNAGACVPVWPLRERIRPAQPLVLYKGGDAVPITYLYCILLNCAQIEPPPSVDPKAIRGLGLCDTLHTSFDVLLRQAWVLQCIRRDAVKCPAGQSFPIERAPIRRESAMLSAANSTPRPSGRRNSCPSIFTTTFFSGWVLG